MVLKAIKKRSIKIITHRGNILRFSKSLKISIIYINMILANLAPIGNLSM